MFRQKGADMVNDMFGTNIKVTLRDQTIKDTIKEEEVIDDGSRSI